MAALEKRPFYNWLSIDAALIAVVWLYCLESTWSLPAKWSSFSVLGMSIWLTYMADRLYDVHSREPQSLLSGRHQFAQRHASSLWTIWWGVLITNVLVAFTFLPIPVILRGGYLLSICLLYTGANQLISKKFFPKELFVALIYTAGIFIFIEPPYPIKVPLLIALLCLLNCLSIGYKEKAIDNALGVRSLAQWFEPKLAYAGFLFAALLSLWHLSAVSAAVAFSVTSLCILYTQRDRIHIERYRILADLALLPGPVVILWLT